MYKAEGDLPMKDKAREEEEDWRCLDQTHSRTSLVCHSCALPPATEGEEPSFRLVFDGSTLER